MSDIQTEERILEAFDPHRIAKDLVVVALWMVFAVLAIYIPALNDSVIRIVFTLPLILFIPGYVLIAALFPGKEDLDGIERFALSFGLSIAVVPLIGLTLNYTPWGIRLDPIVTSLVIFTTAMLLIAQYRRAFLAPAQQFSVPLGSVVSEAKGEFFKPGQSRLDRALSIILILAIAAAIVTTAYVIAVPKQGEKFTEFYILGQGGMAADYPTHFSAGELQTVTIGIGNHEYRTVTYTVEAILLNMTFDPGTNTSTIRSATPLDSFTATLAHNETQESPYSFTAPDSGYNRLQFLLYNETLPSDGISGFERIDASYRDLHLWITVRPPGSA